MAALLRPRLPLWQNLTATFVRQAVDVGARIVPHRRPQSTAHRFGTATAAVPQHSKAALLVIGNEILSGNIVDTNTPWLAKQLNSRGVDMLRVECVPDEVDVIKEAVLRLKAVVGEQGAVITSGGIGPTHDDVTYESVAACLGARLEVHAPTVALMQAHYSARGLELNASRLRMATLPTPSEVLQTPNTWVPLVCCQGVYVLPGIPTLFQAMISEHVGRFRGAQFFTHALFSNAGEGDLAAPLAKVSAEHKAVSIGSYPCTDEALMKTYKVKLTFTSREQAAVEAAVAAAKRDLAGVFELTS